MLVESQEILVHFVRVIKRGNRLSRCKNRALNTGAFPLPFRYRERSKEKKKKSIDQFHPRDLTRTWGVERGRIYWSRKRSRSLPCV